MGAIRRMEKNHGLEESEQEAQEGQETAADEEPHHKSFDGWWWWVAPECRPNEGRVCKHGSICTHLLHTSGSSKSQPTAV
jgi:hypothetical protein